MQHDEFLLKDEGYAILGAAFEVYRELGCGFLEAVYQESLLRELQLRAIPFAPKPLLTICYKNEKLQQTYEPDFICFDQIIVEVKAVKELGAEHRAQLHNYLKATGLPVGYLIDFGHFPKAQTERVVRSALRLPPEPQNP